MNKIKSLFNHILNIIGTIVSLLTFGIIKLNKTLRAEYQIELLQKKQADFEMKRKENMDSLVEYVANRASYKNKLKKLSTEREQILDNLEKAKDKNDKILFAKYAIQLNTNKAIMNDTNSCLKNCEDTITRFENQNLQYDLLIEKQKSDIAIIKSNKDSVEMRKASNKLNRELYMPDGTDNTFNIDEIKEKYQDELIKEEAKSELIEKFVPLVDVNEFSSLEDMEKFIEENK